MSVKNIALFIDWHDFKQRLFDAHQMQPDAELLFDAVGEYGKIQMARAYADWQDPNLRKDRDVFQKLKTYMVQSDSSTSVQIAADVVNLCYRQAHVGTIILVSSGSAFLPLNHLLPKLGKVVKFIGIEADMGDVLEQAPASTLIYDRDIASVSRNRLHTEGSTSMDSNLENAYAWVEDLLRQVRTQGMTPTNLESVMVHLYGFNIDDLNMSFQDLLKQMVDEGRIVLQQRDGKDYAILANAAKKPIITSTPQPSQQDKMKTFIAILEKVGRPVPLTKAMQVLSKQINSPVGAEFRNEVAQAQKQGLVRLAKNKNDNQWYVAAASR